MLWPFPSLLMEHEVKACFMHHQEDDGGMKESVLCCKMELGWGGSREKHGRDLHACSRRLQSPVSLIWGHQEQAKLLGRRIYVP